TQFTEASESTEDWQGPLRKCAAPLCEHLGQPCTPEPSGLERRFGGEKEDGPLHQGPWDHRNSH
ncbi:hypothetical protein P7K49_012906, partial [Saguinus oedipus]